MSDAGLVLLGCGLWALATLVIGVINGVWLRIEIGRIYDRYFPGERAMSIGNPEDFRQFEIAGCSRIESMWVASADQKACAHAFRLWLLDNANLPEVAKMFALYQNVRRYHQETTMPETTSPIVQRIIDLIHKLEAMGPSVASALAWLETILVILGGGTVAQAAPALKCGPDGCCDCGECVDCVLHCTAHAFCAALQAKACLEKKPG